MSWRDGDSSQAGALRQHRRLGTLGLTASLLLLQLYLLDCLPIKDISLVIICDQYCLDVVTHDIACITSHVSIQPLNLSPLLGKAG